MLPAPMTVTVLTQMLSDTRAEQALQTTANRAARHLTRRPGPNPAARRDTAMVRIAAAGRGRCRGQRRSSRGARQPCG